MAIVLKNHPIAYYPIPKVACTSIKLAFYKIEHGKEFVRHRDENGREVYIHNMFRASVPFEPLESPERYFKFAVIRDPIARLLSAYSNRVISYRELSPGAISVEKAAELGVRPDPSLGEFILNLEKYRQLSRSIYHHTHLQKLYLGEDLSYFDRIFDISELSQLLAELKRVTGQDDIAFPHRQKGERKFTIEDLSEEELQAALKYTQPDYKFLKNYYRPPAGTGFFPRLFSRFGTLPRKAAP